MTWLDAAPDSSLTGLLTLRPELGQHYLAFRSVLFDGASIDPVVLELCRLRIAAVLGDRQVLGRPNPDVDVPPELLRKLPSWPTDAAFSPLARAALGLAEMFVLDAHGVSDRQIAEVESFVGAAGVVALTTAIGLFDGESHLRLTLGGG